jgi:rod shape-determining protein MreC
MRVLSVRWKPLALFLCLLLLTLLLTTLNTRLASRTSFFGGFLLSAIMPVQEILTDLTRHLDDLWDGYLNLVHVHSENQRLQRQLAALQGKLHRYQEAYLQQQRLRRLLGFRSATFPHAVAAEVVGIDPSQWARAIIVNKGSRDHVRKDLAVVTHQGLVGRTVEVAAHYATVLLITDRRSAVDALIQRTRARGILVGKSRRIGELRYVDIHEDIQVNDTVISSGLGEVYPKGLLIGTVTSVRQTSYGLFHDAEVTPAVDLAKLEEILVLVP